MPLISMQFLVSGSSAFYLLDSGCLIVTNEFRVSDNAAIPCSCKYFKEDPNGMNTPGNQQGEQCPSFELTCIKAGRLRKRR